MPAKRKAASKAKAGGKKPKAAKPAKADQPATVKDAIAKLKTADNQKTKKAKPDSACPIAQTSHVFKDFDCMLNQTNIGDNNNKFYIIQVLEDGSDDLYTWNRWGRVGENGQSKLTGPMEEDSAVKDFQKKFQDKTKNKWDARADFKPAAGKYTLIEMEGEEEEDEDSVDVVDAGSSGAGKPSGKSNLDPSTQDLVKLIFDMDMFKDAMATMNIDVKKMPLGKLSKSQIAKGFECLEKLEEAIKKKQSKANLKDISSQFYTLIPHSFGRQVPPTIDTLEIVREKMDMLLVLGDIELTMSLQKGKATTKAGSEAPHPLDVNYRLLNCGLEHVKPKSKEYDIINKYTVASHGGNRSPQVLDVWKVNRDGEAGRFAANEKVGNRKLLWHGTNVAVVAAILKSGLRIMPHSGGRVGSGIYFASENSKSYGYVGWSAGNIGIMFLNEVALGKEKDLLQDDHTLKKAPPGFDSVVARGRTEPDPKDDEVLTLDTKKVTVPKGKPKSTKHNSSYFSQSEYLVYREDQCRIRYLIKLKMQ